MSDWTPCREVKPGEQGDTLSCIRPAGHVGKHRGVRMEPTTVWWGACSTPIDDGHGRCAGCNVPLSEHRTEITR